MTDEPCTLHAPALVAQAIMALCSVVLLVSAGLLYVAVFHGVSAVPWQWSAAMAAASAFGLAACFWWAARPAPVLVIDGHGIDWRLSGGPAKRIGWDSVDGYRICSAAEYRSLGLVPPPEKKGERCLVIRLRDMSEMLSAFEADVAPAIDGALTALRQYRPDLEGLA